MGTRTTKRSREEYLAVVSTVVEWLGFEPRDVRRLELKRYEAVVTLYKRDAAGEKYVEDGEPAVHVETLEFPR